MAEESERLSHTANKVAIVFRTGLRSPQKVTYALNQSPVHGTVCLIAKIHCPRKQSMGKRVVPHTFVSSDMPVKIYLSIFITLDCLLRDLISKGRNLCTKRHISDSLSFKL